MQRRLMVLLMPQRLGITITEVCVREGISRQTFYDWHRRFEAGGLAALADRSRRPWKSPNKTDGMTEDEIVRLRAEHADWGPERIHSEMVRAGSSPPSESTIYRILIRNGLIEGPKPRRSRPKPIRFERPDPNAMWQTDATDYPLSDGTIVKILTTLDDHARKVMSACAFETADSATAIETMNRAIKAHGAPAAVLSDNGAYFTGRLDGTVVEFERFLWLQSIVTINSSPAHPQTCGKIERYHSTIKDWLDDNGPYDNIAELQAALDAFVPFYNNERPHQGIANATPDERWASRPPAKPTPGRHPSRTTTRVVNRDGKITYGGRIIGIGQARTGEEVDIIDTGDKITVLAKNGELLNRFAATDTSRYIGSGRPKGRPPTTPKPPM